MSQDDVVIASAVRTPIGTFQGAFSPLSASDLGAIAVKEAARRAQARPEQIERVLLGNVLSAGMGPREVGILRAYARYLHQSRVAYTRGFVESTFVDHSEAARLLVDLFLARFDPDRDAETRQANVDAINKKFFARVDEIRKRDIDDFQAFVELASVANDNDVVLETGADECVAQLGTDAGRLTGCYDEWPLERHI